MQRPTAEPPPPPPLTHSSAELNRSSSWRKPPTFKTKAAEHLHQRQLSLQGYPSASQAKE